MRAFRELCVVLIFVHFGQNTFLLSDSSLPRQSVHQFLLWSTRRILLPLPLPGSFLMCFELEVTLSTDREVHAGGEC